MRRGAAILLAVLCATASASAECGHPHFPTTVGSTWKYLRHVEGSDPARSYVTTLEIDRAEGAKLGFRVRTDEYFGTTGLLGPPDVPGVELAATGGCSTDGVMLPVELLNAHVYPGLSETVVDGTDKGAWIGPASEMHPGGAWGWTWSRTSDLRWEPWTNLDESKARIAAEDGEKEREKENREKWSGTDRIKYGLREGSREKSSQERSHRAALGAGHPL